MENTRSSWAAEEGPQSSRYRDEGTRKVGGAWGPESPVLGAAVLLQPLRALWGSQGGVSLSGVLSDGLIVAHVPDLSSLGLLMQQGKTSQVLQEGM